VRLVKLSANAYAAFNALAPEGAPRKALAAVLAEMMDERVPLVKEGDFATVHGASIMARPVPSTDLAVCYVPAGDDVFVVNIKRT